MLNLHMVNSKSVDYLQCFAGGLSPLFTYLLEFRVKIAKICISIMVKGGDLLVASQLYQFFR